MPVSAQGSGQARREVGERRRLFAMIQAASLRKGQGEIVRWASQHLNMEIGLVLRSDRWVGADYWEQAADRTLTLDELLARSETVVMGVDGGGLDDLLGLGR